MTEPIIKVSPEEWDAQYRAGQWDYLKGVTAHYGVIGALVRKHECKSALDVGCGEGNILQFIGQPFSTFYAGIDISVQATHKIVPIAQYFATVDAASFNPPCHFDCVIFCESLYYMPDPLEVLARYFGFCKIIFLSIMLSDKTAQLIHSIEERFIVVDDFQLVNASGGGWEIMAVKP